MTISNYYKLSERVNLIVIGGSSLDSFELIQALRDYLNLVSLPVPLDPIHFIVHLVDVLLALGDLSLELIQPA